MQDRLLFVVGAPRSGSTLLTRMLAEHPAHDLERLVRKHFDLTPKGIIDSLDLRRPIFRATSYHGHFGRAGFPWEVTDKAEALSRAR